ncbi:LptF/LptG family permease [Pelagibacteraceae bacterium]|nr:LptF/LptG family permease [Pelagibacteraceae bacterium]
MNKIMNQYLIINYSKILINGILIFFALGVVMNLFEEIEFFKNLNQAFSLPFVLSFSFVPTLILELLPFVVFLASMFYFLHLKSSKDLLSIKIFGYSNLKITMIIAFFSFFFGVFILIAVNPITSALVKFYEIEKAKYTRDVDHLISVNKNGVWIKEINKDGYRIINGEKLEGSILKKISIYEFDNKNIISKRIEADSAEISNNPWVMQKVFVYNLNFEDKNISNFNASYEFKTDKELVKISSLFKNLNTLSFIDLIKNQSQLNKVGYSEKLLNEKIHKFLSLPVFLFLMVVLASIFSLGTVDSKQNYYYITISILISVIIYYFKDLSIALGQTGKINLVLSVWMPLFAVGLFCLIGLIQINEK